MLARIQLVCLLLILGPATILSAQTGNRLTYLDEPCDPYYVHRTFPRLETPQWVGEKDVDAVVLLSIDDMRDPAHYERYLRPILDRLKKIDGRAPLSIFTNSVRPDDPQLQKWLKEGVSIEVHTLDHPCPCLQGHDFAKAAKTYHHCVDLLDKIPNMAPVAYRMPCCDSLNTPSPRFWTEIFNKTSADENFLALDSSVFNLITPNDKSLPRSLTTGTDGRPRFKRYTPFPSFVNTIENYPYPYVISKLCWQIPNAVPSDWQAQHVQRSNNPVTVADMKRVLDATVIKKGVYSQVFHPHGWIRNDQIVELIDYAQKKYGKRVKFLSFKDCQSRLDEHLLDKQSLRAENGGDNGIRILDLNNDGFLDVVIGNDRKQTTRVWNPKTNRWSSFEFPVKVVTTREKKQHQMGVQFGVINKNGHASFVVLGKNKAEGWHFTPSGWKQDPSLIAGLEFQGKKILSGIDGVDQGFRFRDLDNDGVCEALSSGAVSAIFRWNLQSRSWKPLPFQIPDKTRIVDDQGRDAGLRFIDLNSDGHDDLVFSNSDRWSAHLFDSIDKGWATGIAGNRADDDLIPMIVRGKTNNGAWFHSKHLWVQNEDTQGLANGVDRLAFDDLRSRLKGDKSPEPRDQKTYSVLRPPPPKTAQASLPEFKVKTGFKVELVCSEPLVKDPVAFDWGTDGKLWVVEMADYPLGLDDRGKPGGRIRFLEDRNGDGKYDKSTLFIDQLPFPTDVMVWRNGILVTAAPNLLYLEDTDNDGKADLRKVLFSGFGEGNQQHRVNGLRWGLDNWVYLANGDSGGKIRSHKTGQVVNINGRDVRVRPDTGEIQAATGQTQHGRNRDDWGNWFGANNSNPMFQFVLRDHYLQRNPHVAPPSPRVAVSTLQNSPLYPISQILSHFSGYRPPPPGQPSRFTSACGTMVYRDSYLGEEFYGNMFVSEPVHNLVHRRLIQQTGLTMASLKPTDELGREFLASRDSWFRPTMIRTAPDGSLWVADMYRLVIEHPEWIDDRFEKQLELRAGHERGRIYRIVADKKKLRKVPTDFNKMKPVDLVKYLASPNGWTRDMAHRVLLWQENTSEIAPLLEKAIKVSDHPLQRLHALCVLDGLDMIRPRHLIAAMRDSHPGVRRHGVRISERFAGKDSNDSILESIVKLSRTEKDALVVRQIAYSLGEFDNSKAGVALGSLIYRNRQDRLISAAGLSGISKRTRDVLRGFQPQNPVDPASMSAFDAIIRTTIGMNDSKTMEAVFAEVLDLTETKIEIWQVNALALIASSLQKRNTSLDSLVADPKSKRRLERVRSVAAKILVDKKRSVDERLIALNLVASAQGMKAQTISMLVTMLAADAEPMLQNRIALVLGTLPANTFSAEVLAKWKSFDDVVQDQLVGAMLRRASTTRLLLDSLKSKQIPASDINATYRQLMLNHPESALADSAKDILGTDRRSNRLQIVEQYVSAKTSPADLKNGEDLFQKTCAACHQIKKFGHPVGPDLTALVNQTPHYLITHILDPDRAVEDKYLNYTLETIEGEVLSGILSTETATSVTLVGLNGVSNTILKKDMEPNTFRRSKKSMMPEGIERSLNPQQLADVMAFVANHRPQPKSFAGNQPTPVSTANDSNALRLQASNAEIYGDTLVYESKYKNLGFWSRLNDRAFWTLKIPLAGTYDVYLDWAVPSETANNPFVIRSENDHLIGKAESTGSWDNYRQSKIGSLNLAKGRQRISFSPERPPKGFLIDLREICLVPTGEKPPDHFRGPKKLNK